MIDVFEFMEDIKKENFKNCYIFCGLDEKIMEDCILSIVNRVVNRNFMELNYMKFDGNSLENFDPVINACETLPFMSKMKVVLVYRASFIGDDFNNRSELSKEGEFKKIEGYLKNMPSHCILIIYNVFKSKRDKIGRKIYNLEKSARNLSVIRVDKLKGRQLEKSIGDLFADKGREIKKVELRIFCSIMEGNNLSTIDNEVEKLCNYTLGREITRNDIKELFMKNSDDDIFDLVNPIANKRLKEALLVLDDLVYKGVKINYILSMVERQFNILFRMKLAMENKKDRKYIMKCLGIRSDYAYGIMTAQCKKFTLKQLKNAVQLCLNAEKRMKSSSSDEKTEMELLIINTIAG